MKRRSFLQKSGLALGASGLWPTLSASGPAPTSYRSWIDIRSQFNLDPNLIHMAQMLLASHPASVREAIAKHRKGFDQNPTEYWEEHWVEAVDKVLAAAAKYLQADVDEIALTDSTTMGLGTLYTGLRLQGDDEVLCSMHEHYSTYKSLDYAVEKNGAALRKIQLYENPHLVTEGEVLDKLRAGISDRTRVVALTWVHSSTGVKLPISAISTLIAEANQRRSAADRIYFCVDGVHGFGIEDVTMKDLGCDFFVAGTHKWLFGPRGTGLIWAKKDAWDMVVPTIPAFRMDPYGQWLGFVPKDKQISFSQRCSPGGFHSFEYRWALREAFDFQLKIGKEKIQKRTHALGRLLRDGLKEMNHVTLHTPMSSQLSSGINAFEVAGLTEVQVVEKLREHRIIGSYSPYAESYARLTPAITNTEAEVHHCLKALERLKS